MALTAQRLPVRVTLSATEMQGHNMIHFQIDGHTTTHPAGVSIAHEYPSPDLL